MNNRNSLLCPLGLLLFFTTTVVADDALSRTSINEGFTEPEQTIRVAASDVGVLASVAVREGDRVRAGDPLCSLDTRLLRASLKAAQTRLASEGKVNSVQAKLRFRKNHLDQIKALREKTHASNLEVTDAELEVDLAQADLQIVLDERRAIEADLLKIQAQLDQRTIAAPIDGLVLEVPKQIGEAVTSSDSHVVTLVHLDRLRIRYFLTTARALRLTTGQQVFVSLPSIDKRATAVVDFISPVTDANSGTVCVELMLDNADGKYRAGLRCLLHESIGNEQISLHAENPNRSPSAYRR